MNNFNQSGIQLLTGVEAFINIFWYAKRPLGSAAPALPGKALQFLLWNIIWDYAFNTHFYIFSIWYQSFYKCRLCGYQDLWTTCASQATEVDSKIKHGSYMPYEFFSRHSLFPEIFIQQLRTEAEDFHSSGIRVPYQITLSVFAIQLF